MKNYLNIRNDIKKIHMKIITYFNIYNKYMIIKNNANKTIIQIEITTIIIMKQTNKTQVIKKPTPLNLITTHAKIKKHNSLKQYINI